MNVKRSLESRLRGWFPQEPALNGIKTSNVAANKGDMELGRKAFKRVAVADGVTVGVFSATHNLIGSRESIEIAILVLEPLCARVNYGKCFDLSALQTVKAA